MEGPREWRTPKFPENFLQFLYLKKLLYFLKCRSFKFFFWILIKRINSNLQEIEKNYICIFTLEIFQNFPRSENLESSHRRCIPLKTFFGLVKFFRWNIFSGETRFSGETLFFNKHTIFGQDPFFGVELLLEDTIFGWNKFFGGDAFLRSFWAIALKIYTHTLPRVWKVLKHCIFQNFPNISHNFQIRKYCFPS